MELSSVVIAGIVAGLAGLALGWIAAGRRAPAPEMIPPDRSELEPLNRVIAAASRGEIEGLLSLACRELASMFGVPQCVTVLLNDECTAFTVVAEHLAEGVTSALGVRFPVEGSAIREYMRRHPQPLAIPDAQTDPRLRFLPVAHQEIRARGIVSVLVLPLMVGSELIGVISLNATRRREFAPGEAALAADIAAILSQALHNSWLFRQLRLSNTRLSAIFDNAALGIGMTDGQGRYILANDRWAAMLGYQARELYALTALDVTHPDDAAASRALFEALVRGERPAYQVEQRFVRKDGSIFWAALSASPIRSPSGHLESVMQVSIDITERKQAEADLRESELKYRMVFEIESDALFLIDNESGQIIEANAAASRLYGYSHAELLGMKNTDLSAEPDRTRQAVADHLPLVPVRWHRKKDGTVFPVEIGGGYLVWQGREAHVAAIRDITERQRAEEERERLIVELDAFSHTVAHDLKSPLGSIMGYNSVLKEDLEGMGLSDSSIMEYVQAIERNSQRMRGIIDELLLLAQVRTIQDIEVYPLDTGSIVRAVLDRLAFMIADYRAEIVLPVGEWPLALGYSPWVEEMWANYVSNALKYGGNPPRVTLGSCVEPDGWVRFWVHDNGPGIAPEAAAQIFEPVSRLDHLHAQTGHGLGLSIVKRIADKLGGRVGVESEAGLGSTFYFVLPPMET